MLDNRLPKPVKRRKMRRSRVAAYVRPSRASGQCSQAVENFARKWLSRRKGESLNEHNGSFVGESSAPGSPRNGPSKLPNRIIEILDRQAELRPNGVALIEGTGSWTYAKLKDVVNQTRIWLSNSGVRAGDRVILVAENCRAFVALLFAISSLDAWPVPVNARLSAREIDQVRYHCGARCTLYTTAISAHARQHAERDHAEAVQVPGVGYVGIGQLNEEAVPEPMEQSGADQVALLLYTSGTTGQPKAVMLTHRNVLFIAAAASKIRSLTPDDVVYAILPMSHVVGFSVVLLGTLLSGGKIVISPRFDPVAMLKDVDNYGLTIVLGVPSMFALLVEYAKLKGINSLNFPSLRIISSSGAPLGSQLKTDVERLFGLTLCNGYGITECSPTIAQVRLQDPRTDTSVGPALPGVELKIVGPDGRPVPEGEVGELRVRGPNVMKGYYRDPEQTAAVIDSDGWFNTRDLARIEKGNLFVIGRAKEMIIRFGFNVYPAEVENVLNTHPSVVRSAVVGRRAPGAKGDEEVVAFVQFAQNAGVSVAELSAYAASRLAAYKVPSQIVPVAEMPMTSTGKIMKDELSRNVAPREQ